jgi:hypothetical protein
LIGVINSAIYHGIQKNRLSCVMVNVLISSADNCDYDSSSSI